MQIVGFNFTKVLAEKAADFTVGSEINTDLKFIGIEKEETSLAKEGNEALKTSFEFKVSYIKKSKKNSNNGEVILQGFVILMASENESKEVLKAWKGKELPVSFRVPIFNFLLKRCSMKALQLEDELNLPLHIPMPHIKLQSQNAAQQAEESKK